MAGLTASGFDPKLLDDIQSEVVNTLHDKIDPTLNLTETSALGQVIGTSSSQQRQLWEAGQALYASTDIEQAEGDDLARLTKITGTVRRGATFSTVLMTLDLDAGTYVAGSLVVYAAGSPADTFANDAEVVSPGGSVTDVPFSATVAGPVRANAATLTVLASAPAGFNSATNPAEAILGDAQETDSALRIRQKQELRRQGSAAVQAIAVDVGDVDGVTAVTGYENDTDATVDTIPPHSVEMLVTGGDDTEIAEAILGSKAGGIRAYGTTTVVVVDDVGNSHSIGFTRPSPVPIYLDIILTATSGSYVGDAAVKTAITDWADSELGVGKDVLLAKLYQIIMSLSGVVNVTTLEIGASNGTEVASSYTIGNRQQATINAANIELTSSYVSGAP